MPDPAFEPTGLRCGTSRGVLGVGGSTQVETMRDHYDFSNAKPNPYARWLKKQVTLRLDRRTIGYFKTLAEEMGIPYKTLINLYLQTS